jgi:cytoskeleton protein RodZ
MSDNQTTVAAEHQSESLGPGPGMLLAQARKNCGLSQQQVADKLNFRVSLIETIEQENFDTSLPATFNRGYLRNYANLVKVPVEEVMAGYERSAASKAPQTQLHGFSTTSENKAQHKLLIGMSCLIVALLVISTAMWWFQDIGKTREQAIEVNNAVATQPINALRSSEKSSENAQSDAQVKAEVAQEIEQTSIRLAPESAASDLPDAVQINSGLTEVSETLQNEAQQAAANNDNLAQLNPDNAPALTLDNPSQPGSAIMDGSNSDPLVISSSSSVTEPASHVRFRFSGDCWVNIYDGSGERIAWGVKKTGYVMNISGVAPWQITLGRPELAEIEFDGVAIDMSQFNTGNIAKFTLPLNL